MKKIFLLLTGLLFIIPSFAQNDKIHYSNLTAIVVAQLQSGKFDSIVSRFDSTVGKNLTAEGLEQNYLGLQKIYGELEAVKVPMVEKLNVYWSSKTPMKFQKGIMVFSLTFNTKDEISGIFFTPQNGMYMMPEYVNGSSFLENKIDFGKEGWKLNGTLTYPNDDQQHPLVIIVHGSGPMDRDGSTGNSKIYRDLAWGLASKGIAVFRYEKRTNTHGSKLYMESYQGKTYTVKDEIVDDAVEAVNTLSRNSHVNAGKIFIAGHSQGGMMAPLIAKESGKVAGIILLAANARPIQDLLLEQMDYLYKDEALNPEQQQQVNNIKNQARYSRKKNMDVKTPVDSLPFNVSAVYWNYLNEYNQVKLLKTMDLPVLVLQGERDYQVTMTDYNLWLTSEKKAGKPVSYKSYPKLNHLFIEGEGRSMPAEYQLQGNMAGYVVDDIYEWLISR